MVEELIVNVNWIAVIVGAIAAYALGALWFSPKMFGRKWMEGVGMAEDSKGSATHAMIAQAIGTFLLAWVIGLTETTDAIFTAILIAITIAVLIKANGLFGNKGKNAIMIESGYVIAMVVVMIIAHIIL